MKAKRSIPLRILAALCAVVLVLGMCGCSGADSGALSLREVGLEGVEARTLRNVTELDLRDAGVTDISMLAECSKLTRLDLRGNEISVEQYEELQAALPDCRIIWDVPILGQTYDSTTKKLTLEGENDGTAGNIRYLTDLVYCNMQSVTGVDSGEIAEIRDSKPEAQIIWRIELGRSSVLSNVTEFTYYPNIHGGDASALRYCNELVSIDVRSADDSADYSALASVASLRKLSLSFSDITDFSFLADLTSLTELNLYGCALDDLSVLSGLTALEKLVVGYDLETRFTCESLDALKDLTSLKYLSVMSAGITDISAVAGMSELETLQLDNNPVEDFSAVAGLTNLRTLSIMNTHVSDLGFLSGLENLRTFYMGDVDPVFAREGYAHVSLGPCRVEDFSPVGELSSLETLIICYTDLSDVSFASSLKNARYLFLYGNNISDPSPLKMLVRLETLALYDNPITMESRAALFLAMPNTMLDMVNDTY